MVLAQGSQIYLDDNLVLRLMNRALANILREVRINRTSGATEIAVTVCDKLLELLRTREVIPRRDFRAFAMGLARAQPNMAPIWNLANVILLSDGTLPELRALCERTAEHHRKAAESVGSRAGRMLVGKVIVTNSYSSAVLNGILAASRIEKPQVRVMESRPMREGLLLARELARMRIPVEVYPDSSMGLALKAADISAIGADAVTERTVIAKVGAEHLGLAARSGGPRLIVLADTSKFAPIGLLEDLRPANEILRPIPRGVRVVNRYFEEVSHELVDRVITEKGLLRPRDAAQIVSHIEMAEELRLPTRV